MARIEARREWNHTGVRLERGVRYLMEAQGQWTDLFLKYGPEGGPSRFAYLRRFEHKRRIPSADWFALCGAVDENEDSKFVIGAGREYTATATGELTCFANDVPGWFFLINNHGSVELKVTPVG
jgi:hypothetical protein